MKLAANYSKPLLQLLKSNPDLPVDYIKVPIWPFPFCWYQLINGIKYRNLLPHPAQPGILAIGHFDMKKRFNRRVIHQIIQKTNPPYLSTNIQAKINQFPGFENYQHQNNPELEHVIKTRLVETIIMIKNNIPVPLVIENYPYYSWGGKNIQSGAQPQFITGLCEQTDCGFLLDTAHAKISASHLKMDILQYISSLPLHRLREIHISGTRYAPEFGIWDSNTVLEDEDYKLLEFVLQSSKPDIITLEYGGYPNFQYDPIHRKAVPLMRNSPLELLEMIERISFIIKDG